MFPRADYSVLGQFEPVRAMFNCPVIHGHVQHPQPLDRKGRTQWAFTSRLRCFLHCTGSTSTRPSSVCSLLMVSCKPHQSLICANLSVSHHLLRHWFVRFPAYIPACLLVLRCASLLAPSSNCAPSSTTSTSTGVPTKAQLIFDYAHSCHAVPSPQHPFCATSSCAPPVMPVVLQ